MEAVGFDDPSYIQHYDLDYMNGRGRAMLTGNIEEAQTWDTEIDVFKAWRTESKLMPIRDDGKPNRPLTAYTISPEAIADCKKCKYTAEGKWDGAAGLAHAPDCTVTDNH